MARHPQTRECPGNLRLTTVTIALLEAVMRDAVATHPTRRMTRSLARLQYMRLVEISKPAEGNSRSGSPRRALPGTYAITSRGRTVVHLTQAYVAGIEAIRRRDPAGAIRAIDRMTRVFLSYARIPISEPMLTKKDVGLKSLLQGQIARGNNSPPR